MATVSRARDLSGGVMAAFVHRVELESLTEEQRHAMLISLSRHLHLGRDVSLERLSKLTAVRTEAESNFYPTTETKDFPPKDFPPNQEVFFKSTVYFH